MGKQKNCPTLRFPEFKGVWEIKKLGEVVKINQGLQIAIAERLTEKVENSFFYITNEVLKENVAPRYYIMNPPISVLCNSDDILMTRTGNTGMVVTNVEGAFHNNFFKVAYPFYISKTFLYNFLKLEHTQIQILRMAGTSTIPDINHSNFYRIKIAYPSLLEQQKIATFLTAVDEKLQALKQKKKLLEQYKKGVMQKIFSQELRFKPDKGREFPEWKRKKLGEVLIKNSNKNKGQKYSLVQSVSNKFGFINQDEMFEDRRVASKDTSNYYVIEKGHFAYNPSRIDVGSLAYKFDDEISVISPLYISFRSNNKFITDEYLLNWFSIEQFLMQMNNSFEGSVRNTLSYDSLIRMQISIPSLTEQTKIANFLSAIDEKIQHSGVQIEKTEIYKKGLLQKMFC